MDGKRPRAKAIGVPNSLRMRAPSVGVVTKGQRKELNLCKDNEELKSVNKKKQN